MWTPQARGNEAQALHDAAREDKAQNPARYELNADAIASKTLAKVKAKADWDVAEGTDWQKGLSVYLASAQAEGALNPLGERNVVATAAGRLQARFAIQRAMQQNPHLAGQRIEPPIFILGGWRTGTTLLQRLLAGLPGLRGLYPAELSAPWRFAGLAGDAREKLLAAGEGAHQMLHLLNPAMAAIHPSGARLAEECVLAMGTDFRNWGFTSTLRCPSYADWLKGQRFVGAYEIYADILRLLQQPDGNRFVLKAPAHTAELESLLTVFPDAVIVQLHRDEVQTVTSGASLFAVFRSTYSDDVDPADVGHYQLETTASWFNRAKAARARFPDAHYLDVDFSALVANPIAVAQSICAAAGVTWTDASHAAAQTGLAALNRQHGVHKYAPEDFGLDAEKIREAFAR